VEPDAAAFGPTRLVWFESGANIEGQ
jgi:hypothetical protein